MDNSWAHGIKYDTSRLTVTCLKGKVVSNSVRKEVVLSMSSWQENKAFIYYLHGWSIVSVASRVACFLQASLKVELSTGAIFWVSPEPPGPGASDLGEVEGLPTNSGGAAGIRCSRALEKMGRSKHQTTLRCGSHSSTITIIIFGIFGYGFVWTCFIFATQ